MAIKTPVREVCERCGKIAANSTPEGIRIGHACDSPVPGPPSPPRMLRWSEAYFVRRDGTAIMYPSPKDGGPVEFAGDDDMGHRGINDRRIASAAKAA